MIKFKSKLPETGTTIFTIMSALAAKHNAINLGQGYPDFDCPDELKEMISHYLNSGKNQYAPMPGLPSLRRAIANKVGWMYGYDLDPNLEITVVAGATQAIFTAITAFVSSGDEVILIEPAYDCYRPAIQIAGGVSVVYELSSPEYKIDWEDLGSLVTTKTRMIIINTPHNPIGKVLGPEDLRQLENLTAGTDILVLSDEVYEHLIYDGREHQSVLRYPDLFKRSIAVYSFGKTFHATGWKIGYALAPAYIMKEFRKVHQFNVFSVNSFIQYALADYLEDPEPYLGLPQFFQRKRDLFQEAIQGSRLKPLKSEGTYFQLFDYSDISDRNDLDFAKIMTVEHGVAAIPVSVFYSNGRQEQTIRLCFAKSEKVLLEAGEKIKRI